MITGTATTATTVYVRFEKMGAVGEGETFCTPTEAPSGYLIATVNTGLPAVSLRDAMIDVRGWGAETLGSQPFCVSGEPRVWLTRVHVGDLPAIRVFPPSYRTDDYQLSISTDGTDFTLLEPRVPVVVAGFAFELLLGDPQTAIAAPALGALGLGILMLLLLAGGAVVLARRGGTVVR